MRSPLLADFTAAVLAAIARQAPMAERRAVLCEFRDQGLTAKDAADALREMCVGVEEAMEDQLHDLLDIATGWCGSSWLVWPVDPPQRN